MILIVGDDDTTREITTAYLRLEGYRVRTVRDGLEALGVVADERPRVMIVDLAMPRLDGARFIERFANSSAAYQCS